MNQLPIKQEGLREKKRRETLQRITDVALTLFSKNGYETTTLDDIAEAAGISRRTFFYYFNSKEEILAAWQKGLPGAIRALILAESTDQSPMSAVKNALLKYLADFEGDRALAIYKIVSSNDELRASNQVKYLEVEQAVLEALCELWPRVSQRKALQITAMTSVGALRLAVDTWAEKGGRKPIVFYVKEIFANL